MNNLLPEEQTTVDTYDKIASIWVARYNSTGFWIPEIKKFHQLLPGGTVLEVGAGGARDAKALSALGYGYIGTDISAKLLEEARKELPNAQFEQQSVYDLSFPDRLKFDGFWASKVLLHLPKTRIDEALVRIKSVMKPGGVGFISLIDGKGEGIETEAWDDNTKHKRYFAYYSGEEFRKVLKRNGYEILEYHFRPEAGKLQWHCFFVQTGSEKVTREAVKAVEDQMVT